LLVRLPALLVGGDWTAAGQAKQRFFAHRLQRDQAVGDALVGAWVVLLADSVNSGLEVEEVALFGGVRAGDVAAVCDQDERVNRAGAALSNQIRSFS